MNTRRNLPELFKTLAKRFGARKAVKLIALTPEVDCTGLCIDSAQNLLANVLNNLGKFLRVFMVMVAPYS